MIGSDRKHVPEHAPERRHSTRRQATLNVLLYHHGVPVMRGRTLDIGLEGVFVHTGPPVFSPDTELELEIIVPVDRGIESHRIATRVRHIKREGLGLAFEDFDPTLHLALRDVLGPGTRGAR